MKIGNKQFRKIRRRERKKQLRVNTQLKKRLYRNLFMYPCCYCKSVFMLTQLTVEHILPLSFGGDNQDSNISLACAPCNHERGRQAWFEKKEKDRLRYKEYHEA